MTVDCVACCGQAIQNPKIAILGAKIGQTGKFLPFWVPKIAIFGVIYKAWPQQATQPTVMKHTLNYVFSRYLFPIFAVLCQILKFCLCGSNIDPKWVYFWHFGVKNCRNLSKLVFSSIISPKIV